MVVMLSYAVLYLICGVVVAALFMWFCREEIGCESSFNVGAIFLVSIAMFPALVCLSAIVAASVITGRIVKLALKRKE